MKKKRPKCQRHKTIHASILQSEHWFSDSPPDLGESFSRKKANRRHKIVTKIVQRAAKRAAKNGQQELAEALERLLKKLRDCRPGNRCGS